MAVGRPLRVRWLGRVAYGDALALQHGLFERSTDDHLLLLEHPPVYTLGVRADPAHVLVPPESVGAELVRSDRGGDVTYHGPGQLVGYPILSVPGRGSGGKADTVAYVRSVEQLLIDTLGDLGLRADRLDGYPGIWVGVGTTYPRKICAIGVRLTRGRSMHGFALNVDPDMTMFTHIVPCGIADKAVTSLAAEGVDASMHEVVDALAARAVGQWGDGWSERQDVAWRADDSDDSATWPRSAEVKAGRRGRSNVPSQPAGRPRAGAPGWRQAGVTEGLAISARKPAWAKAKVQITDDYLRLKHTMRDLSLVTVCEEAGCPNIFECWADGTATFMINGERCTRACGFCLVDTRHPVALDPDEPERVAEAVERTGLAHVVVTTVARDDLADGGASGFVATVEAIRLAVAGHPGRGADLRLQGRPGLAGSHLRRPPRRAQPQPRDGGPPAAQRAHAAVRRPTPRSLSVLARAKEAGLVTKSSLMVGLGETEPEVLATLADLRGVGVDIATVGQYLRPTTHHLPVVRYWTPDEFAAMAAIGEAMGIGHVEASPLTRSSHHARQSASRFSCRIGRGATSSARRVHPSQVRRAGPVAMGRIPHEKQAVPFFVQHRSLR